MTRKSSGGKASIWKNKEPNVDSQASKTKSVDEITGVGELRLSEVRNRGCDIEELQTPDDSLKEFIVDYAIKRNFSNWLSVISKKSNDRPEWDGDAAKSSRGNAHSPIPILKWTDDLPGNIENIENSNAELNVDYCESVISGIWNGHVSGSKMFVVVSKLKATKQAIKRLVHGSMDIQAQDALALKALMDCQQHLQSDILNVELRNQEQIAAENYRIESVYCFFFNATVYAIWYARNEAVWNARVKTPACVFDRIKKDVICRINDYVPDRMSSDDKSWWDSLCNAV
ncbi:hypothetical protein BVRB_5g123960 [Beta vulgaris subsp. vulgaris]|uniref:Uncharacterized protein n=1 Tax=Beta vulgaris subsp. vulgaris TaxID=3555 RepID=A0A0J8BCF4_BETVV|nr:hypothetical protein BVRB_5g123960 [Beta vulgaris subsp. vulgaris]